MSTTTIEIVEKLKSMTLLEAADLVSRIEKTFGVDASPPPASGFVMPMLENQAQKEEEEEVIEEKTSFDVLLEDVIADKKVAVYKVIRDLTSLGLKEAKELTNDLPKKVKESVSKEEAEAAKQKLEEVGAKVSIL